MEYFTIKRSLFLASSNRCDEEYEKIDKFMKFLEKSEIGKLIRYVKYKDKNVKGEKDIILTIYLQQLFTALPNLMQL